MSEFDLGQVVMTKGVAESGISQEELIRVVTRHSNGDWGDLEQEDKEMNDKAVIGGDDRILSSYVIDGEKVWVITEWDRSVTTVLFPSEY